MAYGNIIGQTPQDFLKLNGGTMNGNIDMNNNSITGLSNAVNNNDAVNLSQVQGLIDISVPFSGVAKLIGVKNGIVRSGSGFSVAVPSQINYTNNLFGINISSISTGNGMIAIPFCYYHFYDNWEKGYPILTWSTTSEPTIASISITFSSSHTLSFGAAGVFNFDDTCYSIQFYQIL